MGGARPSGGFHGGGYAHYGYRGRTGYGYAHSRYYDHGRYYDHHHHGWGWGWGWGGYGYPWGWGGYGYPWVYGDVGWYDSPYYSQPYYPEYGYSGQNYVQSNPLEQELGAEVDRLNDEVASLREHQQEMQKSRPPSSPAASSKPTELVFRDKHTEEVQNYAIAGQTLWVLTEQLARKIPLSELDVAATKKANEDRGVEFELPR
jgi:hypothetical protein